MVYAPYPGVRIHRCKTGTVLDRLSQSIGSDRQELECFGKARLQFWYNHIHSSISENDPELRICPGHTAIKSIIHVIAIRVCRKILFEHQDSSLGQGITTSPHIINQLPVFQMPHTELRPYQIIPLLWMSGFYTNRIDRSNNPGFLQGALMERLGEFFHWLNRINSFKLCWESLLSHGRLLLFYFPDSCRCAGSPGWSRMSILLIRGIEEYISCIHHRRIV